MAKVEEPSTMYYSRPQIQALKKRLKASIEREDNLEVLLQCESLMNTQPMQKYDEAYLEAYTDNLCVLSAVSYNLAPTLNKGESAYFKYVEDCGELRVGDVVSYWTVINGEQVVNIGQILEVGANDGGVISFQVKEDVETVWGAIQSPTVIGKLVQVIGAS